MGLYKRGGTWWMSFVYKGRRLRRSTGTANRRQADTIFGKINAEIVEGRWFDVSEERNRTFRELVERFLKEHVLKNVDRRKPVERAKPLLAFFGDATLAEITPKMIVAYKAKRYEGGVGPATINRELAFMKKAFNLAMKEWEWCRSNPVAMVSMEKEPPGRDRYITAEEEARLLPACADWLREIILFGLNTGMRQGEILFLRWSSVDLFRRTATVEQSKNGEKRTIPLNESVVRILKEKSRVRSLKTDFVFFSKSSREVSPITLHKEFRRALAMTQIADFRFHDLRHTFATRLVQAGVDLYTVQRLLGHKTPAMTQRYAHHSTDSLRAGIEVLERSVTNQSQFPQERADLAC